MNSKEFHYFDTQLPRRHGSDGWRGPWITPGLGSLLLADALGRILANTQQVASALAVVDAKDDIAADFYRKHGFIPFGGAARKWFLPIKTIVEAAQRSAQ